MTDHTYNLGKVPTGDYKGCRAEITWSFFNGRFSMQAAVWMRSGRDILMGGQCVDYVALLFPDDAKAQRMLAVWREWHLNDMTAGSPAQRDYLRALGVGEMGYDETVDKLAEAGLNPDPNYLHNGKPYRYGEAWLRRELPAEVVAEIESWSA